MFELTKLKTLGTTLLTVLCAHRALYAGLAFCHASGCIMTDKPELYGPMAVLYGILSVRG